MANIFLFLLLLLTPVATTGVSVWPCFRGPDNSRTEARRLPLHWSETENVAWNVPLPGYGQSSPVVWRDRVFLTAIQGANKEQIITLCYDLKTGRQLWQRGSAATFTQKDADIVSKAAPTPAVDEKRAYVFFESGDLLAFDHKGGMQWQRKLAAEYGGYKTNHGLGSSPALTDKAVIVVVVHGGPSYLLAVDKQTGKNLWKTDLKPGGGWSTPLVTEVNGKRQILLNVNGSLAAYDAETGELLWAVNGLKGNNVPSPSIDPDRKIVIAGSTNKEMNVAVKLGGAGDITDSHILWRAKEATANFASPLIYQGSVYFINKVGVAFCLDLQTGEERWRQRLGGECWASPLAAGDRIYFFGIDGKTFVLRAGQKFEQLAVNTLPDAERIYGVAAVDGALLLRSGRKLIKLI